MQLFFLNNLIRERGEDKIMEATMKNKGEDMTFCIRKSPFVCRLLP